MRGASFVVPLDMVVECVELSEADIHNAHGHDHLNLRGEVLPFIRLKDLFDVPEPPAAALTGADEMTGEAYGDDGGLPRYGLSSTLLTAEGAAALAADPELAFLLHPVKH